MNMAPRALLVAVDGPLLSVNRSIPWVSSLMVLPTFISGVLRFPRYGSPADSTSMTARHGRPKRTLSFHGAD